MAVARDLGLVEQTPRNGAKAVEAGKIKGAGTWNVTPEEMEVSRLWAENMRVERESETHPWRHAPTENWFNSFKHKQVHGVRSETRGGYDRRQLQIHRGVLQPRTPRFVLASAVLGNWFHAQQRKNSCMRLPRWRTKNQGKLTIYFDVF